MDELVFIIQKYQWFLIVQAMMICTILEITKKIIECFVLYVLEKKVNKLKFIFAILAMLIGIGWGVFTCWSQEESDFMSIFSLVNVSIAGAGLLGLVYYFLYYSFIDIIKAKAKQLRNKYEND